MSSRKTVRIVKNDTFYDVGRPSHRHVHYFGGAGSGKSIHVAQDLVEYALQYGGSRQMYVRKIRNTLKESCFRELENAIELYGYGGAVSKNLTDLSFVFPNGSKLLANGLDDKEKLKSVSAIDRIWIEEATEIEENDYDQLDLRLRGERPYPKQIIASYNPITKKHWLKARFHDTPDPAVFLHKSTYLDNAFVGEEYAATMERLRLKNPHYYRVYGLGEWGDLVEGMTFPRSSLVRYSVLPSDIRGVIYCDPNLSKKGQGDTTAIVLIYFSASTQTYYLDQIACRSFSDSNDLIDRLVSMINSRARSVGFDGNVSQESNWRQHFANYCRIRNVAPPVIDFKHYRVNDLAKNAALLWGEGRVQVREGLFETAEGQEFAAQLYAFAGKKREGKNKDDAPDAMICGLELIFERGMSVRKGVASALSKIT